MSAASRVAMALLVIAVLTAVPYFFLKSNGRTEYERLKNEAEDMKAGNAAIRHDNDRMRERIDAFRTHPRLIERRARERLHVARPNEVIFVFDEPPIVPDAGKEAAPK